MRSPFDLTLDGSKKFDIGEYDYLLQKVGFEKDPIIEFLKQTMLGNEISTSALEPVKDKLPDELTEVDKEFIKKIKRKAGGEYNRRNPESAFKITAPRMIPVSKNIISLTGPTLDYRCGDLSVKDLYWTLSTQERKKVFESNDTVRLLGYMKEFELLNLDRLLSSTLGSDYIRIFDTNTTPEQVRESYGDQEPAYLLKAYELIKKGDDLNFEKLVGEESYKELMELTREYFIPLRNQEFKNFFAIYLEKIVDEVINPDNIKIALENIRIDPDTLTKEKIKYNLNKINEEINSINIWYHEEKQEVVIKRGNDWSIHKLSSLINYQNFRDEIIFDSFSKAVCDNDLIRSAGYGFYGALSSGIITFLAQTLSPDTSEPLFLSAFIATIMGISTFGANLVYNFHANFGDAHKTIQKSIKNKIDTRAKFFVEEEQGRKKLEKEIDNEEYVNPLILAGFEKINKFPYCRRMLIDEFLNVADAAIHIAFGDKGRDKVLLPADDFVEWLKLDFVKNYIREHPINLKPEHAKTLVENWEDIDKVVEAYLKINDFNEAITQQVDGCVDNKSSHKTLKGNYNRFRELSIESLAKVEIEKIKQAFLNHVLFNVGFDTDPEQAIDKVKTNRIPLRKKKLEYAINFDIWFNPEEKKAIIYDHGKWYIKNTSGTNEEFTKKMFLKKLDGLTFKYTIGRLLSYAGGMALLDYARHKVGLPEVPLRPLTFALGSIAGLVGFTFGMVADSDETDQYIQHKRIKEFLKEKLFSYKKLNFLDKLSCNYDAVLMRTGALL